MSGYQIVTGGHNTGVRIENFQSRPESTVCAFDSAKTCVAAQFLGDVSAANVLANCQEQVVESASRRCLGDPIQQGGEQ